jgi:hypothetical protein
MPPESSEPLNFNKVSTISSDRSVHHVPGLDHFEEFGVAIEQRRKIVESEMAGSESG